VAAAAAASAASAAPAAAAAVAAVAAATAAAAEPQTQGDFLAALPRAAPGQIKASGIQRLQRREHRGNPTDRCYSRCLACLDQRWRRRPERCRHGRWQHYAGSAVAAEAARNTAGMVSCGGLSRLSDAGCVAALCLAATPPAQVCTATAALVPAGGCAAGEPRVTSSSVATKPLRECMHATTNDKNTSGRASKTGRLHGKLCSKGFFLPMVNFLFSCAVFAIPCGVTLSRPI
jgi:hypothetical protein